MFTGIVQEVGSVARVERSRGLVRLVVYAPKTASRVARLESVAVSGVCLSVAGLRQGTLLFEIIPETQSHTTLGRLGRGDRVNVEPSLCVSDRLNGHIVFGHVDGVGTVVERRQRLGELVLGIRMAPSLRGFVVPKGPITVDGVSLTVGPQLRGSTFTVHLIPETLRQTTLGLRRLRDRVNLEVDYLAKLIAQYVGRARRS